MKAEYLYVGTPSTSLLPASNEAASNNLVRVGVNYHFCGVATPPHRGVRDGEVPAKRAEGSEGSWATHSLRLMTPPPSYDEGTSPAKAGEAGDGDKSYSHRQSA